MKQETQFFNNYLKDPERPELPERPQITKPRAPPAIKPIARVEGKENMNIPNLT